jgi:hypothetical protein
VLFGYIDESYRRGERYWLTVALVPAENVPQLTRDLQRIPRILPAEYEVVGKAELHGHTLFHGTKGFRSLENMIDLRIRIYRKGLEALVETATNVIFVGVEWADPATPSDLGLHRMQAVQQMLPVVEEQMSRIQDHCLLIADEEETTRRDFVGAVRDHKNRCLEDSGQCRIVDNVAFVDSRDSPGVQCADLAVYLHHRVDSSRDRNKRARAANRKLYRVLEGCELQTVIGEGPLVTEPAILVQSP